MQIYVSFVLQKLEKYGFGQLLEVFPFGDNIKVAHRVVNAHSFEFNRLVHVRQAKQLDDVLQVDQRDEVLLAESLEPVEAVLVGRHEHVDGLVDVFDAPQLVRIDELE